MSKLIYSPTATILESSFSGVVNQDQATNTLYRSVAFTGDGYLYTHGQKFRLFKIDLGTIQGFQFSVTNGTAAFKIDNYNIGSGTVVQSVTGDSIISASTSNGVVTLTHSTPLLAGGSYGGNLKIPILTVDAYGHVTAISEGNTIDTTKVKVNQVSSEGFYYIPGVTNDNAQNPLYSSNLYFDAQGNLHANNIYSNGESISGQFAPLSHTSVHASDQVYGHVILSDIPNNTLDTSQATAATPKSVYSALNSAKSYTEALIAAQDAMIFVGTIDATGVIKAHNENVVEATDDTTTLSDIPYEVGWTFRFTTAGTFQGEEVEVGDMIIAIANKSLAFSMQDWTVIQTNISGALTAVSNLDGILYANGSRSVSSLAFGNGVLTSNGATISFVNPNTLWRNINVGGNSIGTNELSLVAGTNVTLNENNGIVTIGLNTASIIGSSADLTITQDDIDFVYHPSAAATLNIGSKLSLSEENDVYTLNHAEITAVTSKFGRITTDGYGHVVQVEDVTSLANQYGFLIKKGSNTYLDYKGDVEKVLKIISGEDIDITLTLNQDQELEFTPVLTHRYRPISFLPSSSTVNATVLIQNNENTVFTLVGGENVTLSNTASNGDPLSAGTLMINAEDTWRNVEAYRFTSNTLSRSSIGTSSLLFSSDFLITNDELGLCWTEIDAQGQVTYVR